VNILTRLGNAWDNFRFRSSLRPEEVAEFRDYVSNVKTGSGYFASFTNTSGETISHVSAMRISTWFTCLQVRWDAVAMLPFNVYRTRGTSKEIAFDHPVYTLLHSRPNPSMTATQFWKVVQQKRDNCGNAYCKILRDKMGKPTGIIILDEDKAEMKVYSDKATGAMFYEYDGEDILSSDILHFKGLTLDGKTGKSLTEYHAETLGRLKAIQKYSNRSISKNPGIYATSAAQLPMNPAQKDAFKDYWNKEMVNYGDSGAMPVLYNGFELKSAGINPKDALYLEQINATKEDIFGITKVPPKLAQNFQTGSTYNNSEQQSLDFLTWGLTINLKDIEDEVNYKLLAGEGLFCKFNEKAILRLDAKTQSDFLSAMFKIGVYSINECRDILDMNPIQNGDDHYVELNNLAPVRLQDEILEGRTGDSVDPTDMGEPAEQKKLREILKKQLNGHDQYQPNKLS
jgi:HK97 family phage portal protein